MEHLPHNIIRLILDVLYTVNNDDKEVLDSLMLCLTCKTLYKLLSPRIQSLHSLWHNVNSTRRSTSSSSSSTSSSQQLLPLSKSLTFGDTFNDQLKTGDIPDGVVERVVFGDMFNTIPMPGALPQTITSLTLGNSFNQKMNQSIIKRVLRSKGRRSDGTTTSSSSYRGWLPTSLRSLTFGDGFNKKIKAGSLPQSITSITFGKLFDRPLLPGTLPASLITLIFGRSFNQTLPPSVLPAGITTLIFGDWFNQMIDQVATLHSLTKLNFGSSFSRPIFRDTLPPSLLELKFGLSFNQSIDSISALPSLTTLLFNGSCNFKQPITIGSLPQSLTMMTYANSTLGPGVLPSSMRSLVLYSVDHHLEPGALPTSLTKLVLSTTHVPRSLHLCLHIVKLTMGYSFDQDIVAGSLPKALTSLTFGYYFNSNIHLNALPVTLHKLTFGYHFDRLLHTDVLPKSLRVLRFGDHFDKPLAGSLPPSLTHLALGRSFDTPIDGNDVLPPSIQHLDLGYSFSHCQSIQYPANLLSIVLPSYDDFNAASFQMQMESITTDSVNQSIGNVKIHYAVDVDQLQLPSTNKLRSLNVAVSSTYKTVMNDDCLAGTFIKSLFVAKPNVETFIIRLYGKETLTMYQVRKIDATAALIRSTKVLAPSHRIRILTLK
ncbi:hypothetical protein SAMD00019534_011640 [Acytostelium subglobosum LB1]|uniref:hypothetical protein n=1 Tax=Acytostelium subglobosum LB1 TaxID=1410327 RepID=UPI0006452096|nr:hypothetical protein SAMD00019534_011640 [Acytostelium subglobosum LB1]GAM17989.1 hypothetical protein SAMD00019534_011640 [Acytostelium subglobosum LB1]|eukprot:XP_012758585.1 hypothetical protein SAMD00019534_011640 [Acytostelium subglobosum LB1]